MQEPQALNRVIDVNKAFGELTPSYIDLVDFDQAYRRGHLMLRNTLDSAVDIKLTNVTLRLDANEKLVLDDFPHWGLVQYKYVIKPTSGKLKLVSW